MAIHSTLMEAPGFVEDQIVDTGFNLLPARVTLGAVVVLVQAGI